MNEKALNDYKTYTNIKAFFEEIKNMKYTPFYNNIIFEGKKLDKKLY